MSSHMLRRLLGRAVQFSAGAPHGLAGQPSDVHTFEESARESTRGVVAENDVHVHQRRTHVLALGGTPHHGLAEPDDVIEV